MTKKQDKVRRVSSSELGRNLGVTSRQVNYLIAKDQLIRPNGGKVCVMNPDTLRPEYYADAVYKPDVVRRAGRPKKIETKQRKGAEKRDK